MARQLEKVEGELEFLRFFYQKAVDQCREGGTDEDYWFKEEYAESGKHLPEGYGF